MALLGIPSKWGSQNELFRQKRLTKLLFLHHGETRIEKQLIPKRSGQLRTIRLPTTTTESTVFLVKHSSTSRWVSAETLKSENKPVVTEKKVWRWRRSNLTRKISKSRTRKIPIQGMKCTTLKSNGLSEVESLELTPGWKSTMLALFGKFGLSELWYKDQNKRLFTGSLPSLR